MINAKQSVVVIAAHPDDEILGCGATIARHALAGDDVHVLIMAEGVTSRDRVRNHGQRRDELSQLGQAARNANQIVGAATVKLLNFHDNRMDSHELLNVVKAVEEFFEQHRPNVVYTHHVGDVNIDHRIVHEAVVTASRPVPGCNVEKLLFFEVASSTEWQPPGSAPSFSPNWFVDVSMTIGTKLKALEAYADEMRPWPHSRSVRAVEHLARWRGANVGVDAAEAFILGRYVAKQEK